jgi:Fic/DOC family protein
VRLLALAEVLELHRRVMAQSGGSGGVRDLGTLESAVAQPRMAFGGQELYETLSEKAAALGFSLISDHPFVDGNRHHPMTPVLIFALEIAVLYGCGSYAMGRMAAWGFGSGIGRMVFYLLVLPGVALHESAHYLACLLTGTRVGRFAPFSPESYPDGRLRLGYVRHERRPAPVAALIGLAPVVLNPMGVLAVTSLLTPLTLTEILNPRPEVFEERILFSGFLLGSPGIAALWAYLAFSFALGSVPSREDLSSVPAALLLFASGALALGFFREGSGDTFLLALAELSAWAVGVYALPAVVAATAALLVGPWSRRLR